MEFWEKDYNLQSKAETLYWARYYALAYMCVPSPPSRPRNVSLHLKAQLLRSQSKRLSGLLQRI